MAVKAQPQNHFDTARRQLLKELAATLLIDGKKVLEL